MRPIYPSRAASALLIAAALMVALGLVIVVVDSVNVGRVVAAVGALGVIASGWVNHIRGAR